MIRSGNIFLPVSSVTPNHITQKGFPAKCRFYLSFAVTIPEFCAGISNGAEWPVEPFEL